MSSYIQMESLVDLRQKHALGRYRRSIAIAALLTGTAILGMILVSGLFHYETLSIDPPMGNSIALRPDYPMSQFDKRGRFSWFLGVLPVLVGVGLAFAGLGPSCVVVTGGLAIAGCVLAAVGAAYAVVGAIQGNSQMRKLRIAQQERVYLGYQDMSARRSIDAPASSEEEFDREEFLQNIFGSNYTFAGMITGEHAHHKAIVAKNNGEHLPVFSFTTPQGTKFHHVFIHNKTDGTRIHRFGFHPNPATTKRQTSVANTEEYFTSMGIDIFDCGADDTNHLNINDQDQMQTELNCAVGSQFNQTKELAVQIYDQTTMETIAAGRSAPFNTDGSSEITDSDYSSCPNSLTQGDNCAPQDDDDADLD